MGVCELINESQSKEGREGYVKKGLHTLAPYMKENTLDLQLPNLRGHACPSMGKSTSFIGHSALIVSLFRNTRVFVMEHVQTCPSTLQAATEDLGIPIF